ncbi:MAG: MBL fold metallo-hydrolase [Rhodospirillales bacterium]|jgi:glyoxylase-like metal-dependent hydrolase (beta-lactamase superfamily II)|nr:MBL fold metallo-hydrolase [Rhodospirillales bacterium]
MDIRYPFDGVPSNGEVRETAPGVFWVRMPLPFRLDHINLWLIEEGDGWTVVDTGIACEQTKAAWERIVATHCAGKPLRRMIVTHFHPDHVGLAGWMAERFDAALWMPLAEWAFAHVQGLGASTAADDGYRRFYHAAGFGPDLMALVESRSGNYATRITPIPFAVRRIEDGEVLEIGGRDWQVIVGGGHSCEHASLYCAELGVLISGDQVLPQISPNISVWPSEPDADPLRHFLASLDTFRRLPVDTLVLPGHRRPFTGLHGRLDALARHHGERLAHTWEACAEPLTGLEVLGVLFEQSLDDHQVFFAIGEALAHLHNLVGAGRLVRTCRLDGVHLFQQAAE